MAQTVYKHWPLRLKHMSALRLAATRNSRERPANFSLKHNLMNKPWPTHFTKTNGIFVNGFKSLDGEYLLLYLLDAHLNFQVVLIIIQHTFSNGAGLKDYHHKCARAPYFQMLSNSCSGSTLHRWGKTSTQRFCGC